MVRQAQSGRSMLEMMGVLAVMGVLSIVALRGYHMAMDRREANDLMHTDRLIAMEMTTHLLSGGAEPKVNVESAWPYIIAKSAGDSFTVQFSDISKNVCQIVLEKNPVGPGLAVNGVDWAGDTGICGEHNVLLFRHNGANGAVATGCDPACGADKNGIALRCANGACVCPAGMAMSGGACVCAPGAETHCLSAGWTGEDCACQVCESGYVLNEQKVCEPNPCPNKASAEGTGDATDIAGCWCEAETPVWSGGVCIAHTCATRMLDALVRAGMGDKNTLAKNFDSMTGSRVHYTGNVEFKEDLDLSDCALDIDGYFYAEDAAVEMASLKTITNENSKIALNLLRATLTVAGNIEATSNTTSMAVKTMDHSTIAAQNLTATGQRGWGISNNDWCNLNIAGKLIIRAPNGIGIENKGDITAGSIDVESNGIALQGQWGVITTTGNIVAHSKTARAISLGEGTTLKVGGSLTGISDAETNGVNLACPTTASAIYYCPTAWVKNATVVPQCAAKCDRGTCATCVIEEGSHCTTMAKVDGACVCQACASGYTLTNGVCEVNTCPAGSSPDGTGDQTDVAGCRCPADKPAWDGTNCGAATCATQMLNALANAGMGNKATLAKNFTSMTGNNVHYTGNIEFKEDLDLSDCALDVDGYFWAENATIKLNELRATTTEKAKHAVGMKNTHLIVSGNITGESATGQGVYAISGSIESTALIGTGHATPGIKIDSAAQVTANTITAASENAQGLDNGGTITAMGMVSGTSTTHQGIRNNGTITAKSVIGTTTVDIDGINSNGQINADPIYFCPRYWGHFSSTPAKTADCWK